MLHTYEFILDVFISRESALPALDLRPEPGRVVSSYSLSGFSVLPGLPFCKPPILLSLVLLKSENFRDE